MRRVCAWTAGVLVVIGVVIGGAVALVHASHAAAGARVGEVIGGIVLCLALLVWASGFGLLGGRIVPLSRPLRRR